MGRDDDGAVEITLGLDDDDVAALAVLGVPEHELVRARADVAAAKAQRTRRRLEVAAHLAGPVRLFEAMQTQWVFAADGLAGPRRVGLDYGRLDAVCSWLGVRPTRHERPYWLDCLRCMEREVLDCLAQD